MSKWLAIAIVLAALAAFAALLWWLASPAFDFSFDGTGQHESPKGAMQLARWGEAEIRPQAVMRLDKAVARYSADKKRYQAIQAMRWNGVPAPVISILHGRESGWNFRKHMHNGDPLTGRTYQVPAGRIPDKEPPYTFEESAEDALYVVDHLDDVQWKTLGEALQAIERYNGLGYQRHHPNVPSPYLWAGTTVYLRGKYVRDGVFDRMAVDAQLGCAAILKRMEERGIVSIAL